MTSRALAPAEIDALDRDGYVIVPDALDAAWIHQLLRAFAAASTQSDGTQHVVITPETPEREAWERLRRHPTILAAASHVMEGAQSHIRNLHGRNPLPGYGQQGLHADAIPRATVKPFFVVTAIAMLDAFTQENGATRVVPGSHLLKTAVPREMAQPAARHPREIIATGAAGSVLILNGHIWHSGRKNESQGPRRATQMLIQRGESNSADATEAR